jgi:hypothetical protein
MSPPRSLIFYWFCFYKDITPTEFERRVCIVKSLSLVASVATIA